MKRREFLATIGALGVANWTASGGVALPTRAQVLSTIAQVNDYWIKRNRPGDNNWAESTYFTGDVAAFDATSRNNYLSLAESWASAHGYGLLDGYQTTIADHHAAGQVYIRLYQITGQSSDYAQIAQSVLWYVQNNETSDWYWIDAINMSMPCFAQLGAILNDASIWAQMYKLYIYPKQTLGLYDQSASLWWRDVNYRNTSYWSRGNGWVFAAHAKVLSVLPQSDPNWAEYVDTFQKMAAKLITLQTSGGYWNSDLAGSTYVGPESSGTAFFLYGLSWGVLNGLLDPVKYVPAIAAAWKYFVTTAIRKTGFLGYVQPVAHTPGPAPSSNTENFGVGAFLLAASQLALLVT